MRVEKMVPRRRAALVAPEQVGRHRACLVEIVSDDSAVVLKEVGGHVDRPRIRRAGGAVVGHPQNSPSVPRIPLAHSTDIFPFSSARETALHVADSFLAARLCSRLARAGLSDSARPRSEQPPFRRLAIDRGSDGDVQAAGARSAHVGGSVVVVVTIAATVLVVLVLVLVLLVALVLLVVLLGEVPVTIAIGGS